MVFWSDVKTSIFADPIKASRTSASAHAPASWQLAEAASGSGPDLSTRWLGHSRCRVECSMVVD
jgi:hypothetical protein